MKRTAWRLLALLVPHGRRMALALFLGFATVASGVGLMATSAYLISAAALHPSIADLQVAIVGVRFFGIARGAARYLERLAAHDVTFRLLARLRVWFYAALEPLAPARLLTYRSGDLLARIVADVETLENFYLRVVAPPAVALLSCCLVLVLVGSLSSRLALVLLAFFLLAGIGLPLLTRALARDAGRRLVHVRAELNAVLVDGIQGVGELLAFGRENDHLARVRDLGRQIGGLQERLAHVAGLDRAMGGLLVNLATLAVLAAAIPRVAGGQLDGVYLAVLALTVIAGFEAVLPLPQALQTLDNSLAAARRLFEIVDAQPAVVDPARPAPPPETYSLQLENVGFAYPGGGPPALEGVNLALPAGGRVAVVGPSGAGKSTLVQLLLRFWDPGEGRICLGGRDLRDYAQGDLRRAVAVVSQHTHLFNASVRENLLLARPDAGEAEMVRAARQAQIDDFCRSLPRGYETWIGEQGLRLSGGQRQRLAIARALLQNAPLLLLDEPTANLDALTERQVLDSLQDLMAGRTVLMITHRLLGLEAFDEILVLRAGRVVERGRHHELLQMGGLYRRMWDLQRASLVLP